MTINAHRLPLRKVLGSGDVNRKFLMNLTQKNNFVLLFLCKALQKVKMTGVKLNIFYFPTPVDVIHCYQLEARHEEIDQLDGAALQIVLYSYADGWRVSALYGN